MRLLCALKMWQMLTSVRQSESYGMLFVKGLYLCAVAVIRRGFERVYALSTEDMVGNFAQNGCIAAITEVSSWLWQTCHSHLVCGRVPPVCHLHYDPFQGIPDELQGLSALEYDIIALRIPFMKLRALASSCSWR
jgi:hypothetical protein